MARGEVSTAALAAYGAANSDAYDLLDNVPAEGPARLSAWCAFVLQTHADNLIGSGSAPGYCDSEALAEATTLYQLTSSWLDHARAAPGTAFEVAVPQPYPRPRGPQGLGELRALRKTLETVQSRLGSDLAARESEAVYGRLQPTLPVVQAALDASAALLGGGSPRPEVAETMAQTLLAGLDRAHQAGQLLAMTELISTEVASPPPRPPVTGAAALTMFLPGDPGFDPWCLTDPQEQMERRDDGVSAGLLETFWQSDPAPDVTLGIQADIAMALESGMVTYLPRGEQGSLGRATRGCPWPGAFFALGDLTVGGEHLDAGDRFVFVTGSEQGSFHRAIARISSRAVQAIQQQEDEAAEVAYQDGIQAEVDRERERRRDRRGTLFEAQMIQDLVGGGLDIISGDW